MNICARMRGNRHTPGIAICYFVFMRLVINGEERNFAAVTLDG